MGRGALSVGSPFLAPGFSDTGVAWRRELPVGEQPDQDWGEISVLVLEAAKGEPGRSARGPAADVQIILEIVGMNIEQDESPSAAESSDQGLSATTPRPWPQIYCDPRLWDVAWIAQRRHPYLHEPYGLGHSFLVNRDGIVTHRIYLSGKRGIDLERGG